MSAKRKLLGRTAPRLWTPPLRPLNRRTSRGYEAAEFADAIGEPFLPWQRWLAIHALETNPDGGYRFRVIVVLVARQNGKSSFGRTLSLYKLYIDGVRLVLGVAADVSLAREMWQMSIDTIEGCADLAEDLGQVRRVNGDEWFRIDDDLPIEYQDADGDESLTLAGGGRYKIAASSRKAGRGLSVDQLNIDELREWRTTAPWSALSKTTMARANAQIWCMSNAGDDGSVVLNQLRDAALSGRAPSVGLFEWSAEDDCELDDWTQIAQANPGLGYTINEEAISTAIVTDLPGTYRTEVLCQHVEQLDGAINYTAWKACHDPAGNLSLDGMRDRLALCFDMAPDGKHCTLAAAAKLDDGRPRVRIVKVWESSDQARAELPAVLERIRPAALTWFPAGPAAGLGSILRPAALTANKRTGKRRDGDPPEDGTITGTRVAEICQELADLVRARRVIHPGDPLLNAHVKAAAKLKAGDGWRFGRAGGHVDAAYAAAGAIAAALAMPEPKRARLRMLG